MVYMQQKGVAGGRSPTQLLVDRSGVQVWQSERDALVAPVYGHDKPSKRLRNIQSLRGFANELEVPDQLPPRSGGSPLRKERGMNDVS